MATFSTSARTSGKRTPCLKLHWTREEDDLLTALVRIHGPIKWDMIATHIHGRSGKSCRVRWINQLKPGVTKTPFSPEEKRRLVLLHREYGNKWSVIANYFPGRTDNQVKNHQSHILARTRYNKATGPPSRNDHNGSEGLSRNQNTSVAPIASQFSDVTSRGTTSRGFAPSLEKSPFIAGSSSIYGNGESSTHVYGYGSSMVSDTNNAGMQGDRLIDFLGVGFWGIGSSD